MPRKKITFQDRFPGLNVEPSQQVHLMRLAETYAGYKRDMSSLTWLLQLQNLEITPDDKTKLRYGLADVSMKLDFTADLIGNNAMMHMVCQKMDVSTISSELNLCGEKIAPVYTKYRKIYFQQQMNGWLDLYKQADSIILNVSLKEPKNWTPYDKLGQYSVMAIRTNIKECAIALGVKPETVFRAIRDTKLQESLNAEIAKIKSEKEQKIIKNFPEIGTLLQRIEKTIGYINSLSPSVRPPLDDVDALQRDMMLFKKLAGMSLMDWYRENKMALYVAQKQR